jgi:hypothetical protein
MATHPAVWRIFVSKLSLRNINADFHLRKKDKTFRVLGCDTPLSDEWFPTFQTNILPSFPRVVPVLLTLENECNTIETSGTTHPVM